MAKLSIKKRKLLPKTDFAVPSKAPASGSFPINNPSHARNALARSAGKPIASQVKTAVKKKYPGIAVGGAKGMLQKMAR